MMRIPLKGALIVLVLGQIACGIGGSDGIADAVRGFLGNDACNTSGSSRRDGDGALLIYQLLDEEGTPEPGLVVVDEQGEELRRIDLPEYSFRIFPARSGNKALVFTDDHRAFLVDAEAGTAQELDIPPDAAKSLIPKAVGYQWIALADPLGDSAFLVDLSTGDVTDLMAASESPRFAFFLELSPDEENVLVLGDELWLVPTDEPGKAHKLGEERAFGASFSCDGELVAYAQRNGDTQRFQVIIENLKDSGDDIVAVDDLPMEARYVPGSENLIIFRSDTMSLLSPDSGEEQELLAIQDRSLPYKMFAPNGKKMLLGKDQNDEITWKLIDLENGDILNIDELRNFYPRLDRLDQRWVYFFDDLSMNEVRNFASLDLETGEVNHLIELDDHVKFAMLQQHPAMDGSSILLRTEIPDGQQIWLLNGEDGSAQMVSDDRGINAALSPNGRWVALNTVKSGDGGLEASLELIDIDRNETKQIGEGSNPIAAYWLFP